MTGDPGYATWTVGLRVRKNAKLVTSEGLTYIFVKMLAGPPVRNIRRSIITHRHRLPPLKLVNLMAIMK